MYMKLFKLLFIVCCSLLIGFANIRAQPFTSGAGKQFNQEYIGGVKEDGARVYRSVIGKSKANYIVNTNKELVNALRKARNGDFLYINDGAKIDLTGYKNLEVKAGVTLYGNRGLNGSQGPLIYTDSHGVQSLFRVTGDNVKFFGIRIRGADGETFFQNRNAFDGKSEADKKKRSLELYRANTHASPVSSGIETNRRNLTIENCEIYQWTHTAVYLKRGAKDAEIINNYIHHNQRFGLGYGVLVDQAEALIAGNIFDYNRHAVASTGRKGSKYIVQHNIFKEGGVDGSWSVDMHGGKDRKDGTDLAGTQAIVKNNTFYVKGKRQAFVIRGRSELMSEVRNNKIFRMDDADVELIQQRDGAGNFRRQNNVVVQRGVEKVID